MPSAAAAAVLSAGETVEHELPMPPWAFGLIAFGVLCALLLIALQFNRDR